jgi:hypothetical protein
MTGILRLAVLAAGAGCLAALLVQAARLRRRGVPALHAEPAGMESRGIRYAFTAGMAPGAKESATRNPWSYGAGLVYHLGVFAALALLGFRLAAPAAQPPLAPAWGAAVAAGLLAGIALLAKRAGSAALRAISCPDDFGANLLVDLFLGLSAASLAAPVLVPAVLGTAVLLFAYIPMGKIRHCFFFFYCRAMLGAFMGRRGAFPPGGDTRRV